MTALFDGLSGLLNDVFGGPVTVILSSGAPRQLRGMFREYSVDDGAADGRPVATTVPTLRLLRPDAVGVDRGSAVYVPGRSETYLVLRRVPTASPAADAFVFFELEQAP